jgi:membrane associated rhomboid family serine protease
VTDGWGRRMGIYDREYYRESTRDNWSEWFGQRGTVTLIVITVCVFLVQMFMRMPGPRGAMIDPLVGWGAFHVPLILSGEVWRLLTPIFLHADPIHLLFNMFVLYVFGTILEGVYGTREFVTFYLVSGLLVSVGEFVLRLSGLLPINVTSIGASGAVTALLVLFACHFPYRQLRLFFLIPIPAWLLVCVLIAVNVLGLLGPHVNHTAHLLGAAIGGGYYFFEIRFSGWMPSIGAWLSGRRTAKPRLRVWTPADAESPTPHPRPSPSVATAPHPARPATSVDEQLEAKLDHVLEKVAREGKGSLTPEENDILLRASDIYKRRRGG